MSQIREVRERPLSINDTVWIETDITSGFDRCIETFTGDPDYGIWAPELVHLRRVNLQTVEYDPAETLILVPHHAEKPEPSDQFLGYNSFSINKSREYKLGNLADGIDKKFPYLYKNDPRSHSLAQPQIELEAGELMIEEEEGALNIAREFASRPDVENPIEYTPRVRQNSQVALIIGTVSVYDSEGDRIFFHDDVRGFFNNNGEVLTVILNDEEHGLIMKRFRKDQLPNVRFHFLKSALSSKPD